MKLTTTTRTLCSGQILTENRKANGKLHDPDDGTPARVGIYGNRVEQHWTNGKTIDRVEEHWENGKFADAADGKPSVIIFYTDGSREEQHCKNDRLVSVRTIPAPGGAK